MTIQSKRTTRPKPDKHSLPHEIDETPDADSPLAESREVVKQAARDIRRGLRDTERRGTPSDVPGPSDDLQHTRGADVPLQSARRKHR